MGRIGAMQTGRIRRGRRGARLWGGGAKSTNTGRRFGGRLEKPLKRFWKSRGPGIPSLKRGATMKLVILEAL